MFRILRIYDESLPVNRMAISNVQAILRSQFNELRDEDIDSSLNGIIPRILSTMIWERESL